MSHSDPQETRTPGDAWERTVIRDVMVGRQIGEYRVVRRLGAGGMGVVYEGIQPLIGRRVAIKFLRPEIGSERGLLEEARAANAVRHRGIVDVYGYGELPGLGQYLVMEHLEGEPLDVVLRERGRFTAAEVVPLLDELLAALDAAHSRGVVHRDLKPSNIFVVEEPGGARYLKVLDFGLAKRLPVDGKIAHQTRASAVVGTPHYMAPEQACGEAVGPWVDVYAVGIIAFELLSGDVPFDGVQPLEIAVKHVQEPPPLLCERAAVPPELHDLVHALLAKSPDARPSVSATRRALKRIGRLLRTEETQLAHLPVSGPSAAHAEPLEEARARPAPKTTEAVPFEPALAASAPNTSSVTGRRRLPWALGAIAVAILAAATHAAWPRDPHLLASLAQDAVPQPSREAPEVESEGKRGASSPALPAVAAEAPVPALPAIEPQPPAEEATPSRAAPTRRAGPPVRAAAPSPASAKGTLLVGVIADVRGDVYVDGRKLGSAPLERELPAGRYELRIQLANGITHTERIDLAPGARLRIRKQLDAATQTLKDVPI